MVFLQNWDAPDETSQTKGDTAYQLAVVGSDAGLLAEPAYLTAPVPLRIGVAERYGVIIDFSKFPKDVKQVYLKNLAFPFNLGTEPSALMRFDLLDDPVTDKSKIPSSLGIMTNRKALEDRAVTTRTFRFGRSNQWTINNNTWNPARVEAIHMRMPRNNVFNMDSFTGI